MAHRVRWEKLFTAMDKNSGGTIEAQDFKLSQENAADVLCQPINSPEVQGAVAAFKLLFDGMMKLFDANGDGKVTKVEFMRGVERNFIGKELHELPAWWLDSANHMIQAADTNKNGEVSLEELTMYLKRVNPSLSSGDVTKAYEWVIKLSPQGKLDKIAATKMYYLWATSPVDHPELRAFITV